MSDAYALAALTALLREVIVDRLKAQPAAATWLPSVDVRTTAPDQVVTATPEKNLVSLFLHHVGPNAAWRNRSLPERDADGRRVSNPPLALDAHYLLTVFGSEDLAVETILGHALQALHLAPVLGRDYVREKLAALTLEDEGLRGAIQASGIGDQFELIKVTLEPLGIEELSKLWTAFQKGYRRTSGLVVSVVLIEARRPVRTGLPVRQRRVFAVPFVRPVIDDVEVDVPPGAGDPWLYADSHLAVRGSGLAGSGIKVLVGTKELAPKTVASERLVVDLADADLRAGVQVVTVVRQLELRWESDEPPDVATRRGPSSNSAAFMLHPRAEFEATGLDHDGEGVALRVKGSVSASGLVPAVGPRQRVALLLSPGTGGGTSYELEAPARNGIGAEAGDEPTGQIDFAFEGVVPGTYLVRIRVDGAESALAARADGGFSGPAVELK